MHVEMRAARAQRVRKGMQAGGREQAATEGVQRTRELGVRIEGHRGVENEMSRVESSPQRASAMSGMHGMLNLTKRSVLNLTKRSGGHASRCVRGG